MLLLVKLKVLICVIVVEKFIDGHGLRRQHDSHAVIIRDFTQYVQRDIRIRDA